MTVFNICELYLQDVRKLNSVMINVSEFDPILVPICS